MALQDGSFEALEEDATRRGGNQTGLKQYNERLILSLIQEAGALSKADIARITRLSSQTVTIIVNRLLDEGLLRKKEVIRGRVGQPSTPIELDPDGALSIGVKIGRRSLDIIALAFDRRIVARHSIAYAGIDRETVDDALGLAFAALTDRLTGAQKARLVGTGIAAPTAIAGGEALIGDPGGSRTRWREADLVARVEEVSGLRPVVMNDAAAACLAEIELGDRKPREMVYFYISTLIGGGLVVGGKLMAGRTGNAGAVNALPLGLSGGAARPPPQLIDAASLNRLEDLAAARGLPMAAFRGAGGSPDFDADSLACFDDWAVLAADALAFAAISGTSFIEAEAIVIDGVLPPPLLDRLIAGVRHRLGRYTLEGILLPELRRGRIGFDARAIGAALLPLNMQFMPDNAVLLKS